MSNVAISVENLGKSYRIGSQKEQYDTLRDSVMGAVRVPLRRLRHGPEPNTEEFWALRDVSFELKHGEILGVIGRNGAGKSTLLKILSQITEPSAGRAVIHGRVGSLLEVGTGFHPELTGRENVYLNGAIIGMSKRDIAKRFDEIVAFADIEQFLDTPVKRYSSGMYTRLAFSVAAHLEPEVLIVDEVLSVGDAAFQRKSLGKMGDVAREGRTVLFVSHNMAAVRALCRRAVMLGHGELVRTGNAQDVVDGYLSANAPSTPRTRNDAFPAVNTTHGIGIENCIVTIDNPSKDTLQQRLVVDIDIIASRPHQNVGVGISLNAADGSKVSVLGPAITNFMIDLVYGRHRCRIVCDEVDTYLAGGDYTLSVWLSRPKVEYLVRVDHAAIATIAARDVFSTGNFFETARNGVVPLPVRFEGHHA